MQGKRTRLFFLFSLGTRCRVATRSLLFSTHFFILSFIIIFFFFFIFPFCFSTHATTAYECHRHLVRANLTAKKGERPIWSHSKFAIVFNGMVGRPSERSRWTKSIIFSFDRVQKQKRSSPSDRFLLVIYNHRCS